MCIQGFVVLRDFFAPEELEPVKEACAALVDEVAIKLHTDGKISSKGLLTSSVYTSQVV